MPLCSKHGQVYGEGSACIVCEGGTPHHEANNLPTLLSTDDRNAYEKALASLTERVEKLEAHHKDEHED